MALAVLKLLGLGLLDVVVCCGLYLLDRHSRFKRLKPWAKQLIYGVIFGGLAILGTEAGIQYGTFTMNIRDAAPLCAGLLFGWPAGLLAGVIGAAERFAASYWGIGTYTQLACSLATLSAGLMGAALRHFMFDDKKASWYYSLSTGLMVEVFHMLLIFLTHMNDIEAAFLIVKTICWPMIAIVGLTCSASSLCLSLLSGEKMFHPTNEQKKLAQSFQRWLLLSVILGFVATSLFTYFVESKRASSDCDSVLSLNVKDVKNDIDDASDNNLLKLTATITTALEKSPSSFTDYYTEGMTAKQMQENATQLNGSALLTSVASSREVSEINIVNAKSLIIYSNNINFIGFDMNSGAQAKEFSDAILVNLNETYVQSYQPISYNTTISMKYAAQVFSPGGYVQVGYNAARFQKDIDDTVVGFTKNRHVGTDGYLVIASEDDVIVSNPNGDQGQTLTSIGLGIDRNTQAANLTFSRTVSSVPCYCYYTYSEGYYIVACLAQSEVSFNTSLSVYINVFMEVEVFAMLFIVIYFLVKHLVVNNITKINGALNAITGGNLNVSVNVRSNAEFASLSDDINSTVVTLKGYIKEAAARIDKELEFAKEIQLSALPAPLTGDPRFLLSAKMLTAKEVGGDFYDYFLIGDHKIGLVIADVSGKGIPAALFMMKSKTLIKSLAENGEDSPAKILQKANIELSQGNDAEMFVTVWLGIYDFTTHILTTSNAGHEFPAVKHANAPFEFFHDKHGFVLAGMAGSAYKEEQIPLNPGDTIFVYTDGVTEATSKEQTLYGESRLLDSLNAADSHYPSDLIVSVKTGIDRFVDSAPQFDDITMLCFHVVDEKEPLALKKELSLDASVANVEAVTAFVNAHLEAYDCPIKEKNQIDVAIDELFSNIAHYAYNPEVGPATVRVEVKDKPLSVYITFIDKGVPYDPLKKADPDLAKPLAERDVGGLGIYLVKKTMDDIVYDYKDGQNILTIKKTIEK